MTAYEQVGWDNLSPYARQRIDEIAQQDGVTLHWATDVETLRRYIRIYRNTNW
jgi:hypothetical protein